MIWLRNKNIIFLVHTLNLCALDILIVFIKDFFLKKLIKKRQSKDVNKSMKYYPACKELSRMDWFISSSGRVHFRNTALIELNSVQNLLRKGSDFLSS